LVIDGHDQDAARLDDAVRRVICERRSADLCTIVAAPGPRPLRVGRKLLVEPDGATAGSLGDPGLDVLAHGDAAEILATRKSRVVSYEVAGSRVEVFHEVLEPKPQLLIVGAGHIAVPLARFGHQLGFEVVVIDDREKFASVERFPDADQVIAADFGPTLQAMVLTLSTYIVIITRAHTYDEEALRIVLGRSHAYLGMIGSRRRVQTVLRILAAEGYDPEELRQIRAPIGLDVAAETPDEIALSIIAEVVAARRGGTGLPLSQQMRPVSIAAGEER
jgi:xanthine dehydrogenase accessory factor